MTLLGVIRLGDRYLFGADGKTWLDSDDGTGIRISQTVEKIFRLEHAPRVVWGFTGSTGAGFAFGDWIRESRPASWDELQRDSCDRLAMENGRARKLAEVAGGESHNATDVLMCGSIKGEMRVVHFYDNGDAAKVDIFPHFAGGGRAPATVAWNALGTAKPAKQMYTEKTFRTVFEVVANSLDICGLPITIEDPDAPPKA
jgi:hypothetical protein